MSYQSRNLCIVCNGVTITGAGTPVDIRTVAVPAGVTRWVPTRIALWCEGTGGSLAAATLGLWTQAGGAGTSLLSAASGILTNMTTTGQYQALTVSSPTAVYTSTGITLRQDIPAAASATGTVGVLIYIDSFA